MGSLSIARMDFDNFKTAVIAGGAAGNHTLAGITTDDQLAAVLRLAGAGVALKTAVLAGGAAGDHTLTGIAAGDDIVSVLHMQGDGTQLTGAEDLTSEFTITAADTLNNTGGTASTNGFLIVVYADLSADDVMEDLRSEFSITAANTLNNTGGTVTTGDKLLVFWVDKGA